MKGLKLWISLMLLVGLFPNQIHASVAEPSTVLQSNDSETRISDIALTAVSDLNAQPIGINSVKLTWNAVSGADGYIIYRKIGDGKFEYRYMISGTSYTDTTAQTGEYNFYRVYPYKNVDGVRVLGPSDDYDYAKPTPNASTNLNAQATGVNSVKLTWSAVDGADGYIIYRKIGDGKFEYRYMVSSTTYTDTTAQTGVFNFYRVYPYKNVNGTRVLGPSNEYKYAKPMPLAVSNLKAVKQNANIKVTWNSVSNVDGYIIYRQAPGESKMTYRYMVSSTSFTDTQTSVPGNYFYRVYAYKNVGDKRVLGSSNAYVYANIPKTIKKYAEGMYRVGTDIPAGEYIVMSDGGFGAYYEVTNTASGGIDNIIANGNTTYNVYITVSAGQYIKVNRGVLYPVNNAPDIKTDGAGMFKVGKDIQAGTYNIISTSDTSAYYAITNSSSGKVDSIVDNGNFNGNRIVTVTNGQYLEVRRGKIVKMK